MFVIWYLCLFTYFGIYVIIYDYQLIQETQRYKKVEKMVEEMRSWKNGGRR
jgi:hypothetical protein